MIRIEDWTNEQLSAQCVFPRLDTDKYNSDTEYKNRIKSLIGIGIGGFCVFGGNTESVRLLTSELQGLADDIPLLFSADFEFGVTMRLEDGTSFPHAMALGKTNEEEITRHVAKAIAKETKYLGIDWNLAPVCDINNNPKNPIINIRAFGTDSDIVIKHSKIFIEEFQKEKLIACAKHFPGHGNTAVDSHIDVPVLSFTKDELASCELLPFAEAVKSGVMSIMVGHLSLPAIDNEMPASLSYKVITELLKEEMGYKGVVLTDALDMKALSDKYTSDVLSVWALKAGNDIALMPENAELAIKGLSDFSNLETSFRDKLIESVKKIHNLKRRCGLIPRFAKADFTEQMFINHQNLALKAAYPAVEVIGSSDDIFPLPDDVEFSGFAFLQKDDDLRAGTRFFTMLSQAAENNCNYGFIDSSISDSEIDSFIEGIKDSRFLIFAYFYKSRAYQSSADISEKIKSISERLAEGRRYIAVMFGNPYLKDDINADVNILTYSDSFASMAAAVMKLTGRELNEYKGI